MRPEMEKYISFHAAETSRINYGLREIEHLPQSQTIAIQVMDSLIEKAKGMEMLSKHDEDWEWIYNAAIERGSLYVEGERDLFVTTLQHTKDAVDLTRAIPVRTKLVWESVNKEMAIALPVMDVIENESHYSDLAYFFYESKGNNLRLWLFGSKKFGWYTYRKDSVPVHDNSVRLINAEARLSTQYGSEKYYIRQRRNQGWIY